MILKAVAVAAVAVLVAGCSGQDTSDSSPGTVASEDSDSAAAGVVSDSDATIGERLCEGLAPGIVELDPSAAADEFAGASFDQLVEGEAIRMDYHDDQLQLCLWQEGEHGSLFWISADSTNTAQELPGCGAATGKIAGFTLVAFCPAYPGKGQNELWFSDSKRQWVVNIDENIAGPLNFDQAVRLFAVMAGTPTDSSCCQVSSPSRTDAGCDALDDARDRLLADPVDLGALADAYAQASQHITELSAELQALAGAYSEIATVVGAPLISRDAMTSRHDVEQALVSADIDGASSRVTDYTFEHCG